jgi:hypothetical protein
VLTPFQERIAAIVAGLDEAEDFALAGGGALIVRGDVDRSTRDLDFFGLTIESVDRLAPAVERALTRAGMEIVTLQSNQGFVRLVASLGNERCEIDLAADARLFDIDTDPNIPTLTGEELAVDKVLAIFGRAEARDFIDLAAVEPKYDFERLCELAAEKDRDSPPTYSERCSTDSTAFNDASSKSMMIDFGNLARQFMVGAIEQETSLNADCSVAIEEMISD